MQFKKKLKRAYDHFMASSFAQKSVLAVAALTISVGDMMAASKGAAGFTKATTRNQFLPDPGFQPDEGDCCRNRLGRSFQRVFQDVKRRPGREEDHHAHHRRLYRLHRAFRGSSVVLQITMTQP